MQTVYLYKFTAAEEARYGFTSEEAARKMFARLQRYDLSPRLQDQPGYGLSVQLPRSQLPALEALKKTSPELFGRC